MKAFKLHRLPALAITICASSMTLMVDDASAQNWPSRPLRIRVGFPPGGTTDILARVVGQKLQESLKVPVIVENKGGAVGSLDAAALAQSPLDDHTFMMVPPGVQSINQFLYKSIGYDPENDFVSVGLLAQIPNTLVVNTEVPAHTLNELISLAKAKPNALNYSSSGVGASGQLLTELLKTRTGIQMVHVPYRGNGPALQALLAGQVQVNTDNNPTLLGMIRANKVRALAVSTEKRWAQLPDVPTFAELGYPELTMAVWYGLIAQSMMPKEIVVHMNRELNAILNQPEMISRLSQMNLEPIPGTPEAMARFVRSERERWKKVIEVSGARLD